MCIVFVSGYIINLHNNIAHLQGFGYVVYILKINVFKFSCLKIYCYDDIAVCRKGFVMFFFECETDFL